MPPTIVRESAEIAESFSYEGESCVSLNLKLLRVQRGLTLEQLAQKTELTRSYLSKSRTRPL